MEHLKKILQLIDNDKLFEAYYLYEKYEEDIDKVNVNEEEKKLIRRLKQEYAEAKLILSEIEGTNGWDLSHHNDHLEVFYSTAKGDMSIYSNTVSPTPHERQALKIKELMNVPISNVLAVFYEIDFYKNWVPKCTEATLLSQPSTYRVLSYYRWKLFWPFTDRDLLTVGYGIDRLNENGSILVVIKSVDPIDAKRLVDDPQVIQRMEEKSRREKITRLHCHYAGFQIRAISPTQTEVVIISNIDPHLDYIPTFLQHMATKYASPILMKKIRQLALNLPKDYRKKMEEKNEVYQDIQKRVETLLAKFNTS